MEKHRFVDLLPLLFFTALSGIAAGLMMGIVGFLWVDSNVPNLRIYLALVLVVSLAGLGLSLFHLGKKTRFMRSLLGIHHSWLSREVVMAGMFAAGNASVFFLDYVHASMGKYVLPVSMVTSALGIILAVTIGLVYRLPARQMWKGVGFWLGFPVVVVLLGMGFWLWWRPSRLGVLWFLFFWVVDGGLVLRRTVTFRRLMQNPYRFIFPRFQSLNWKMYLLRMVLSGVVLVLVVCSYFFLSIWVLMLCIFLDRFALYLGMDGIEPVSEIAHLKAQRMAEAVEKD